MSTVQGVLVDSSVLLDIVTDDPHWFAWSSEALATWAEQAPLYINVVIYAEVSMGGSSTANRGPRTTAPSGA
jgi:hypothetical protein